MTASNGSAPRTARCRFCGRMPGRRQHQVPGPEGPICTDCLEAGLQLARDGRARPSQGGTNLLRVNSTSDSACEFCGRRERTTFLGFHRPLARMSCPEIGSVICLDCLDHGGDIINKALRH